MCERAGLASLNISPRIAARTYAASKGYSEPQIQAIGQWKSMVLFSGHDKSNADSNFVGKGIFNLKVSTFL